MCIRDRDLIDPEAFTQEWSTYVAKGKNHRYGLCFTWDIANIDNNTDYVLSLIHICKNGFVSGNLRRHQDKA